MTLDEIEAALADVVREQLEAEMKLEQLQAERAHLEQQLARLQRREPIGRAA